MDPAVIDAMLGVSTPKDLDIDALWTAFLAARKAAIEKPNVTTWRAAVDAFDAFEKELRAV